MEGTIFSIEDPIALAILAGPLFYDHGPLHTGRSHSLDSLLRLAWPADLFPFRKGWVWSGKVGPSIASHRFDLLHLLGCVAPVWPLQSPSSQGTHSFCHSVFSRYLCTQLHNTFVSFRAASPNLLSGCLTSSYRNAVCFCSRAFQKLCPINIKC